MAYPTNSLAKTIEDIDRAMIAIRANTLRARDRSLAGPVGSTEIFDTVITLRNQRAIIVGLSGTPGLAAYAQAQKGNETLDVAAEFNAVVDAINNVVSWVGANFPAHDTFLLAQTLGANGPIDRQFTTTALATYRTQLDALIATID